MSFSRSMTSKDRSGRTWTTIMWMELVPMSMAAMRMQGGAGRDRPGLVPLHGRYILAEPAGGTRRNLAVFRPVEPPSYHEPSKPRVTSRCWRGAPVRSNGTSAAPSTADATASIRRAWPRAAARGRAGADGGRQGHEGEEGERQDSAADESARHRARARCDAAGARRADGRETLPRLALEEVRAHVVHRARRAPRGDAEAARARQPRQSSSAGSRRSAEALAESDSEEWRDALGSRLVKRAKALGRRDQRGRAHVRARAAASGADRRQEAALRDGARGETRRQGRGRRRCARSSARRTRSAGCTICRCCRPTSPRCRRSPTGRPLPDGGLDIIARALEDQCRHLHARYVASIPRLTEVAARRRGPSSCPQLAQRRGAAPAAEDGAEGPDRRGPVARPPSGQRYADGTLELYLIRHGVAAERGEEYPGRLQAAADERRDRPARKEAKALDMLTSASIRSCRARSSAREADRRRLCRDA